jgi:hypothetical protein
LIHDKNGIGVRTRGETPKYVLQVLHYGEEWRQDEHMNGMGWEGNAGEEMGRQEKKWMRISKNQGRKEELNDNTTDRRWKNIPVKREGIKAQKRA